MKLKQPDVINHAPIPIAPLWPGVATATTGDLSARPLSHAPAAMHVLM